MDDEEMVIENKGQFSYRKVAYSKKVKMDYGIFLGDKLVGLVDFSEVANKIVAQANKDGFIEDWS